MHNLRIDADTNEACRDNWARTVSPNPAVKVYIGAPASSTAAGSGYLPASNLASIATQMRKSFPSFGGVMLWDASQAYGESNVNDIATAHEIPSYCSEQPLRSGYKERPRCCWWEWVYIPSLLCTRVFCR